MNIVLVVVDSLRRDALGNHTPNLDRLVRESLDFDHAFSASYPTIPFRTDVMTGRYGTPFNSWKPLRFDVVTLPRVLAEAGYTTQLIHDTPHLVNGGHAFDYPFHAWTFVRGAEVDRPWIDDRPLTWLPNWRRDPALDPFFPAGEDAPIGPLLSTYNRSNRRRRLPEDWNVARLFSEAARFLKDNARRNRFFLWVDCFDPHEPWDAPPEDVRAHDPDDPDGRIDPRLFDYVWLRQSRGEPLGLPTRYEKRLRAQYAAKVSHMDRWLGVMLDAIDDASLSARTAVVLVADHGTCLGEQGRFSKRRVGHTGWEEGNIPLLLRAPGIAAGRDSRIVQPQDVFATVLGLAGAQTGAGTDGLDLLGPGAASTAWPREIALMGDGPHAWAGDPKEPVVSAFTRDWCLNLSADPGRCRLFSRGSLTDEAARRPDEVAAIRGAALAELGRRGLERPALRWLAGGGQKAFPAGRFSWDGPKGWSAYWGRLYDRW